MKTETKRRVRALRVLDDYRAQDDENFTDAAKGADWFENGGRFLLIEQNTRGEGWWASRHGTAQEAATYHDEQEYAGDWYECRLVDLDSGETFDALTTTTWAPAWGWQIADVPRRATA